MAVKLSMLLVMLFFIKHAVALNTTNSSAVALPGCQDRCGSLVIPYPFGIGPNCSASESMEIYCNTSFIPPKAFLMETLASSLEVLNISLEAGTIRINYPVTSDCTNTSSDLDSKLVAVNEPFTISNTENRFTAMGCNNLALLSSAEKKSLTIDAGGCVSKCEPSVKRDNNCFGINCCQIQFPPYLSIAQTSISGVSLLGSESECDDGPRYAFIVDQRWFGELKDIYSVQTMGTVPAVLNWKALEDCQAFTQYDLINATLSQYDLNGTLSQYDLNGTLCGVNALCTNQSLCSCREGYQGNPYLRNGCQDIDECATQKPESSIKRNKCAHYCTNTPGNYSCSCKDGWLLVDNFKCVKKVVDHSVKNAAIIVIGTCAGLGVLLAAIWWSYKVIRQRNTRKLEEKFFKRNGGMLLQQVSSSQENMETIKLFSSKELEKATDHYNIDRVVGQGGQGTVYKGMLTDGKIVAVKKSKIEDENKLEHFVNEIKILSQINHRNVVKLHGCCLQTEVPLLVYEFIPNGTLMKYIHEDNEYFPLTWEVRLRVATEIAGALYYLHSAASIPIYHRDIKSTNILLDDKYRAKVADFGISRSFSIDQTHLTTRVQGTFGYLDPEYFQSSQFTEKSDVYSFGVVLVELLTGQKPILATRLDDKTRGLSALFLLAMEENRIFDILDSRIANVSKKEEMMAFANIAYRCLNMKGRERPTMKQVAAELESIRNIHESHTAEQNYEKAEYEKHEQNLPWESYVTSSSISSTVYHSLSVDTEPFLTN